MTTLLDQCHPPRRRRTSRPAPSCSPQPCTCSDREGTPHTCPTYRYDTGSPSGPTCAGSRTRSPRSRGRAAQSNAHAQLGSRAVSKEELQRARVVAQRVPRTEIHALLPRRWPRSCSPYPDHRSARGLRGDGSNNKRFRQIVGQRCAEQINNGCFVLGTIAEHPDLSAVLHRHLESS